MPLHWSKLSTEIQNRFTMNSLIKPWYYDNPLDSNRSDPLYYSEERIQVVLGMTARYECGCYGAIDTWIYLALQKYSIKDLNVCIIGSTEQGYGPWYEAIVLNMGGKPTTVDYNEIIYKDPKFKFMSVDEAKSNIDSGYRFDCLLSVSSIEHDGLGRYGDPINPDADLETMDMLRSYVKPNGLFFITVPVGMDQVVYNAHRIYGPHRLHKLLEKWSILDTFGYNERLLNRDTQGNWNSTNSDGTPMFKWYPAYEPLFVLQNTK